DKVGNKQRLAVKARVHPFENVAGHLLQRLIGDLVEQSVPDDLLLFECGRRKRGQCVLDSAEYVSNRESLRVRFLKTGQRKREKEKRKQKDAENDFYIAE